MAAPCAHQRSEDKPTCPYESGREEWDERPRGADVADCISGAAMMSLDDCVDSGKCADGKERQHQAGKDMASHTNRVEAWLPSAPRGHSGAMNPFSMLEGT